MISAAWGWESGHSGGHKCLCSATERWHRGLYTWAAVTNRYVVIVGYTRWKNQAQFCKKEENWPTRPLPTKTWSTTVPMFTFPSPTLSAFHNTLCQVTPSQSSTVVVTKGITANIVQIWLVRLSQCECTGILYTEYKFALIIAISVFALCLNQPQQRAFILPVSFLVSFSDSMRMRLVSFPDHILSSLWGWNETRQV